jgi:hypothetical protein
MLPYLLPRSTFFFDLFTGRERVFFFAVSNAIDFDQHAGSVPEIAADGGACGIRPRKTTSINCVVAQEETRVAEVGIDLDYITKRSAVCLEDGGDVIDGLLRLFLNVVADQLSGDRVDGTRSGYKQEIPGPPSLGVGPSRWCTTLGLNYVFGHLLLSWRPASWCRNGADPYRNLAMPCPVFFALGCDRY